MIREENKSTDPSCWTLWSEERTEVLIKAVEHWLWSEERTGVLIKAVEHCDQRREQEYWWNTSTALISASSLISHSVQQFWSLFLLSDHSQCSTALISSPVLSSDHSVQQLWSVLLFSDHSQCSTALISASASSVITVTVFNSFDHCFCYLIIVFNSFDQYSCSLLWSQSVFNSCDQYFCPLLWLQCSTAVEHWLWSDNRNNDQNCWTLWLIREEAEALIKAVEH